MQFSDILASLIHDMKNSLGMVINTLEELTAPGADDGDRRPRMIALQQEAKRLNSNLIELLTLYKIENDRIAANIDQVDVEELLEELALENGPMARSRGVALEWECPTGLSGYFDEGLVRGVLNNLIGNGLRYTRSRLRLVAEQQEGYLVITVEDDGDGFPDAMLEAQARDDAAMDGGSGRTHLGIYFSRLVAELHRDGERRGSIRLANGGPLGGGRFSLCLP